MYFVLWFHWHCTHTNKQTNIHIRLQRNEEQVCEQSRQRTKERNKNTNHNLKSTLRNGKMWCACKLDGEFFSLPTTMTSLSLFRSFVCSFEFYSYAHMNVECACRVNRSCETTPFSRFKSTNACIQIECSISFTFIYLLLLLRWMSVIHTPNRVVI